MRRYKIPIMHRVMIFAGYCTLAYAYFDLKVDSNDVFLHYFISTIYLIILPFVLILPSTQTIELDSDKVGLSTNIFFIKPQQYVF